MARLAEGPVSTPRRSCGSSESARRELRAVSIDTSQHTVPFYERMGFRTTSVMRDGYAPGLDRCEMILELDRDNRNEEEA